MTWKNFANHSNLLIRLGVWPIFKNFNQSFLEIQEENGFIEWLLMCSAVISNR